MPCNLKPLSLFLVGSFMWTPIHSGPMGAICLRAIPRISGLCGSTPVCRAHVPGDAGTLETCISRGATSKKAKQSTDWLVARWSEGEKTTIWDTSCKLIFKFQSTSSFFFFNAEPVTSVKSWLYKADSGHLTVYQWQQGVSVWMYTLSKVQGPLRV